MDYKRLLMAQTMLGKQVTPYNKMNPVKRTALQAMVPFQNGINALRPSSIARQVSGFLRPKVTAARYQYPGK